MTNETSTTTPTTNLYPGIKKIADAYRQAGFRIIDYLDGNESPPTHNLRYEGDYPEEGYRGADLAQRLDFPLMCLSRVWNYDADEQDRPYWQLTFMVG